jgi:hypothetical protein
MKSQLKKLLGFTLILLLSSTLASFGQVYKLRSSTFSSKYKVSEYSWSEWSELAETNVLITFDLAKDRITIYSKTTQVYDIAEYEEKITDKDGDDILSYFCVNQDGLTCRVRFVKLNSQNGRNQVYVDFSDMMFFYNTYFLE